MPHELETIGVRLIQQQTNYRSEWTQVIPQANLHTKEFKRRNVHSEDLLYNIEHYHENVK